MLFSLSAPVEESDNVGGDVVSQRILRCESQPDQIRLLREMADEYAQTYAIRSRARDIVFRVWPTPPKDKRAQALAIASWVQDNVTYVEERPEVFQTPLATVACGYGDCDDQAVLVCALLTSLNIDNQLVGMRWRDQYRHIFPAAVCHGEWLPLDTTLSHPVADLVNPIRLARERGLDVSLFVG